MIKGKIYKITCLDTNNIYYGSTTKQYLCNRKSEHKAMIKRYDEGKIKRKCESYDIIKNNNFTFELVEELECENKQELLWRERHYIDNNKCVNKTKPIATKEELKIKKYETEKKRREKPEVLEQKRANYNKWFEANKDKPEVKQAKAERDKKYREKKKLLNL